MMIKDYFMALRGLAEENIPCATGLVLEGIDAVCPTGTKLIYAEGLRVFGDVAAEIGPLLADRMAEMLRSRQPGIVKLAWQSKEIRVFVEPIYPQARLVILGGGHIALPLAALGKILDFHVTVVDDRPDFANRARFPDADEVLCQDFSEAIRSLNIGPSSYLIIVTRGHRHDRTCLEEVMKQGPAAYVGMIGSRRKVAAVLNDLRETGTDPARLGDIYAPIGLDIGAQTPEEIAVSIMAEIIMVQHKGCSDGLKNLRGGMAVG